MYLIFQLPSKALMKSGNNFCCIQILNKCLRKSDTFKESITLKFCPLKKSFSHFQVGLVYIHIALPKPKSFLSPMLKKQPWVDWPTLGPMFIFTQSLCLERNVVCPPVKGKQDLVPWLGASCC